MKDKEKMPLSKWFENYWYYYKVHTIVIAVLLAVTGFLVYDTVTTKTPDAEISYFGGGYFSNTFAASLVETLTPYIDDVNHDKQKLLVFSPMAVGNKIESEEDLATLQKAQLMMAVGESYLYFLDKHIFETYQAQGMFIDISQYLGKSAPTYGFLVSDSKILRNLGVSEDMDVYVALRVLPKDNEKNKKSVAVHSNALKILQELAKNN